jgi:hypothetical protein
VRLVTFRKLNTSGVKPTTKRTAKNVICMNGVFKRDVDRFSEVMRALSTVIRAETLLGKTDR